MVIIINYLQKIHRVFEPFLKQWYSKVPVMMIQENDNVKYCKRDWLPLLSTSSMHVWITCGMLLPSRLQNELHMDLRQCSIGKWNWNTYFWLITADKCLSTIIGLYTFLIDNKHQCASSYNHYKIICNTVNTVNSAGPLEQRFSTFSDSRTTCTFLFVSWTKKIVSNFFLRQISWWPYFWLFTYFTRLFPVLNAPI